MQLECSLKTVNFSGEHLFSSWKELSDRRCGSVSHVPTLTHSQLYTHSRFSANLYSSLSVQHSPAQYILKILFIFTEGKGWRKRGREISMGGCFSRVSSGDLARNPGMYPDWELNWCPFGSQAMLKPLSHTSQGILFLKARVMWVALDSQLISSNQGICQVSTDFLFHTLHPKKSLKR